VVKAWSYTVYRHSNSPLKGFYEITRKKIKGEDIKFGFSEEKSTLENKYTVFE
jgi:hypothetical protein